jgi:hypothetical protein
MRSDDTRPKAALRTWRASIIRKRLARLGRVYADNRATAEAVAVKEFRLTDEERKRLLIEEVQ